MVSIQADAWTGGRVVEAAWDQRRISTGGRTWLLPRAFLALVVADLGWEIVKTNAAGQDRSEWPWRFTVLDTSTCAAIVVLLTGIIVTRTQLSLTLQPALSWSASVGGSRGVTDSLRTIVLVNAGGGRSVVHRVQYRIRAAPDHAGASDIPSDWMSWHAAISSFMALDLDWDRDIFLLHLGTGAAIPMVSRTREGMELLALGPKAVERLAVLDIRIQVTDVLGDIHQRDLQCIRPAHRP